MIVDARLSPFPRHFAECGTCGRPIVRRDRVAVDPPRKGKSYVHVLRWGPEWRLIPAHGDDPAYLTRDASSAERYDRGEKPVRRQPGPQGAAHYIRFGPPDPLAQCSCGVINRMDPKVLDVSAL